MKFTIAPDLGDPTYRVRLTKSKKPDGVLLQVGLSGGKWKNVCTLCEDGTLALWDVGNEGMRSMGFDMRGASSLHPHGGFISVKIA